MLPEDTSIQNVSRKPSMGSFSTNTLLNDLNKIVLERSEKINSPEATLQTVELDTSGILEAKKAIDTLVNRSMEQVPEQPTPTTTPTTPKKIGGEIKHPLEKTVTEQQMIIDQQNERIARLETEKLNPQNNSAAETVPEQPEMIHIQPSETALASVGNLLPNFNERKIAQPEVITSEALHETPSELSKVRSGKLMPKISAPRPRLINGEIKEERIKRIKAENLLKKEITPEEALVEVGREIISDVVEGAKRIDTAVEKITRPDYKIIGGLADKLVKTKADALKIFNNMFSDEPTSTGGAS